MSFLKATLLLIEAIFDGRLLKPIEKGGILRGVAAYAYEVMNYFNTYTIKTLSRSLVMLCGENET